MKKSVFILPAKTLLPGKNAFSFYSDFEKMEEIL